MAFSQFQYLLLVVLSWSYLIIQKAKVIRPWHITAVVHSMEQ